MLNIDVITIPNFLFIVYILLYQYTVTNLHSPDRVAALCCEHQCEMRGRNQIYKPFPSYCFTF